MSRKTGIVYREHDSGEVELTLGFHTEKTRKEHVNKKALFNLLSAINKDGVSPVAYIPRHAKGDLSHEDVEFGYAYRESENHVRVKFSRDIARRMEYENPFEEAPGKVCRKEDIKFM